MKGQLFLEQFANEEKEFICLDDSLGAFFWISKSERGVLMTRNKASKSWSDRRYTDIHITVEWLDWLEIFEND